MHIYTYDIYMYVCIFVNICVYFVICIFEFTANIWGLPATGWRRPMDALSLYVFFCKRALQLEALLRKMTCNLRHPMSLRHPVPPLTVASPLSSIYM